MTEHQPPLNPHFQAALDEVAVPKKEPTYKIKRPDAEWAISDTPSLTFTLTRDEMTDLQNLARRSNTSPKALGQIAVRQLLRQAKGLN